MSRIHFHLDEVVKSTIALGSLGAPSPIWETLLQPWYVGELISLNDHANFLILGSHHVEVAL